MPCCSAQILPFHTWTTGAWHLPISNAALSLGTRNATSSGIVVMNNTRMDYRRPLWAITSNLYMCLWAVLALLHNVHHCQLWPSLVIVVGDHLWDLKPAVVLFITTGSGGAIVMITITSEFDLATIDHIPPSDWQTIWHWWCRAYHPTVVNETSMFVQIMIHHRCSYRHSQYRRSIRLCVDGDINVGLAYYLAVMSYPSPPSLHFLEYNCNIW